MTSRCITIYTDASVCDKTQTGGWGAWIKRAPGETQLASGVFKNPISNIDQAELMAIANGLAVAIKVYGFEGAIYVVVTDSQTAMNYINAVKKPPKNKTGKNKSNLLKQRNEQKRQLAETIWRMLPMGGSLRINKVKAHNGRQDGARSYINNMVDNACRAAMRKGREAKKS